MLQDERQQIILKYMKENKSVRIGAIAKTLGVTRETVRKDLYELEKRGEVKKVHGGAVLARANEEPPYDTRAASCMLEKELIARRAAELVEDGDAIYIDSGTTTLMFAQNLRGKSVTVVTSALLAALELSRFPELKVILTGGEIRPGELSLSGPVARRSMELFRVDKAFVGTGGISADAGFTDYHVGDSDLRSTIVQKAKETYVLADSSKSHIAAFFKVAELSDIDYVVTDSGFPDDLRNDLEQAGVQVIIA